MRYALGLLCCTACFSELATTPTARLTCTTDADCPPSWSCDERSGRCLSAETPPPRCGDGALDIDESCDCGDSGTPSGGACVGSNSDHLPDRCRTDCTLPRCGDGAIDAAEECDDGNLTAADGCSPGCAREVCGNGRTDPGETCDDGNTAPGDGCSGDCLSDETCGNAYSDFTGITPEGCDCGEDESMMPPGCVGINGDPQGGCTAECQTRFCGNGVTNVGEECDDGNRLAGDDCSPDCLSDESCGNGYVDVLVGETCDDGNEGSGDGCGATCRIEICGNGVTDPGEACDDGDTVGEDGCSADCRSDETCGNGVVDATKGEICDAGAQNSDDPNATCRSNCQPRRCGDAIIDAGTPFSESCDGALLNGATCASLGYYTGTLACTAGCTYDLGTCAGRCGDGIKNGSEGCDGSDFGGATCGSMTSPGSGTYYAGSLQCTSSCTLVAPATTCSGYCGDSSRNGAEACDGSNFGGLTCGNMPSPRGPPYYYYSGGLSCGGSCGAINASACTGYCGDGVVNGLEVCDSAAFGTYSCGSFGFYGGSLGCSADCGSISTSGCDDYCGDGTVNGAELCDGAPPPSKTCISYGYDLGVLGCSADLCVPDFSGCGLFGWQAASYRPDASPFYILNDAWVAPSGKIFLLESPKRLVTLDGGTWTAYVTHPDFLQQANLDHLWPRSETDIYICGNLGSTGSIHHFDGSGFTKIGGDIDAPLNGVAGSGPNDLFAVGGPNGSGQRVFHFNGTAWSPVAAPAGQLSYTSPQAVHTTASGVTYVAGSMSLFWTCTATGCATVSPAAPTSTLLQDIHEFADGTLAVVGGLGTVGFFDPAGPSWDWHTGITPIELRTGWGQSRSDFFAAGYSGEVHHYNGITWSQVDTGTAAELRAIVGRSNSEVIAVGYQTFLRFDGVFWDNDIVELGEVVPAADMAGRQSYGFVGFGPDAIYTTYGNTNRYFRFDGLAWTDVSGPYGGAQLYGIGGVSETNLAIGGAGEVLRHDGTNPTSSATVYNLSPSTGVLAPVGATYPFYGIQVVAPNTVYAASGLSGLFKYNGSTWSVLEPSVQYSSLWAASATALFGVGFDGNIVTSNGTSATVSAAPIEGSLNAVHGTSANDVFAVGQAGHILHYSAGQWTVMASPTQRNLFAVHALASDDVFAAGEGGTILHYNGTAWRLVRSITTRPIHAIHYDGGAYVYFAAKDGHIARLFYSGSLTQP